MSENLDTIPVLDHGYVTFIEPWGADEDIIEAARMSTQKGFEGWGPRCVQCGGEAHEPKGEWCNASKGTKPGDEKLLRFLWEHGHHTPFEMAGFVIEVQLPIFVAREWHRHRTQSYNEMSARYAPLPALDYVPTIERLMANARGSNRQANRVDGAPELTELGAEGFQRQTRRLYDMAEEMYQSALACGVPKELARIVLPVGRYTRMRASANLRNWLHFLSLRLDPSAQWEIRQYAEAVSRIVEHWFPRTWELFKEGKTR